MDLSSVSRLLCVFFLPRICEALKELIEQVKSGKLGADYESPLIRDVQDKMDAAFNSIRPGRTPELWKLFHGMVVTTKLYIKALSTI